MFADMIAIARVQESYLYYWHTERNQIYVNLLTPYWNVKLKSLEMTRIELAEMCDSFVRAV
jgi:hypothetical protein